MNIKVLRGLVTRVAAAPPAVAADRLAARFAFETDCADVASDLAHGAGGFVVIDARSPAKYLAGHVPGALNLPTRTIDASSTASLDPSLVYVTYCDGPHCNGSTRSALRLAELGFSVKEMLGGFHFWQLDGHPIDTGSADTGSLDSGLGVPGSGALGLGAPGSGAPAQA